MNNLPIMPIRAKYAVHAENGGIKLWRHVFDFQNGNELQLVTTSPEPLTLSFKVEGRVPNVYINDKIASDFFDEYVIKAFYYEDEISVTHTLLGLGFENPDFEAVVTSIYTTGVTIVSMIDVEDYAVEDLEDTVIEF